MSVFEMNQEENTPINGFTGSNFFLSNFFLCPVQVSGIMYGSSEAAFMAGKTLDHDERLKFQHLSPKQAKTLGRRIKLRADWDVTSIEVMELCLRAKFTRNKDLQQRLIDTGERELIEFNNWGDQKWGVTKNGGKNLLGRLLMLVREDLKG